MQRRKFLVGMGSLAAGGAAAMGTGAFQSATAERQMEIRVASDSAGYIGFLDTESPYSSVENGQVTLDFSEIEGQGGGPGIGTFDSGKGLNPDSTYRFENLFQISEREYGGELRVAITKSGFNLEDLEVTTGSGDSLLAENYDAGVNAPKISGSEKVDMNIETKGSTDSDAGGTLVIHAAAGANHSEEPFSSLF